MSKQLLRKLYNFYRLDQEEKIENLETIKGWNFFEFIKEALKETDTDLSFIQFLSLYEEIKDARIYKFLSGEYAASEFDAIKVAISYLGFVEIYNYTVPGDVYRKTRRHILLVQKGNLDDFAFLVKCIKNNSIKFENDVYRHSFRKEGFLICKI